MDFRHRVRALAAIVVIATNAGAQVKTGVITSATGPTDGRWTLLEM